MNKKSYYVFSAYCDSKTRYAHCDFFIEIDTYPSKSDLKKIVRDTNPWTIQVVILSITKMSAEEFKKYWK